MAGIYSQKRRNVLGSLAIVLVVVFLFLGIRHNEGRTTELNLLGYGSKLVFSQPLPSLRAMFPDPEEGPPHPIGHAIDLTFGMIISVNAGADADISHDNPRLFVDALLRAENVEVVFIQDLPLTDPQFQRLTELKRLRELGLKSTKITAKGIAEFKAARPDVAVVEVPASGPPGTIPAPQPAQPTAPAEPDPEKFTLPSLPSTLPGNDPPIPVPPPPPADPNAPAPSTPPPVPPTTPPATPPPVPPSSTTPPPEN